MSSYHGTQAPNFSQHIAASRPLMPKKHPITNDYTISARSLGVGVNGKVLECVNKKTGEKRALKVTAGYLVVGCVEVLVREYGGSYLARECYGRTIGMKSTIISRTS